MTDAEMDRAVLAVVVSKGSPTPAQIATHLDATIHAVSYALDRLEDAGKVRLEVCAVMADEVRR